MAYTLYVEQQGETEVMEDRVEKIGQLEPPLQNYELVDIFPANEKYAHLTGQRGVVSSNGWNPETGEWNFGVTLQNGEGWSFMEDELKSTGRILDAALVEQRWDDKSIHSHGKQYVPLTINLNDF